jgi:hypothetical protein
LRKSAVCWKVGVFTGYPLIDGEADQLRSEIEQLRAVVQDVGTSLIKRKIELDAEPRVSILERAN